MQEMNFASWMIAHHDPHEARDRAHRVALATARRLDRPGLRERLASATGVLRLNRSDSAPSASCCPA